MEQYLTFPLAYTFKIIGLSTPAFHNGVNKIFAEYEDRKVATNGSGSGKYTSYSVTVHLFDYEELKARYEEISQLDGLKFHV